MSLTFLLCGGSLTHTFEFTDHLQVCTWVCGQLESHLHWPGLTYLEFGQLFLVVLANTKLRVSVKDSILERGVGEQGHTHRDTLYV